MRALLVIAASGVSYVNTPKYMSDGEIRLTSNREIEFLKQSFPETPSNSHYIAHEFF